MGYPSGKNLGFGKGNSKAFQFAKGEYVVALNNGTEGDLHWVEWLVRCLNRHLEAGFCNR